MPQRSATVRWLVLSPSYGSAAGAGPTLAQAAGWRGSPGAIGLVSARSGLIRQAREAAYRAESSSLTGTSLKAGSPTQRLRSAKESREASRKWW